MAATTGCYRSATVTDPPVADDVSVIEITSSQAAFWLNQDEPMSWTCRDIASHDCLDSFVQQWWSHAQMLIPTNDLPTVRAKTWFFEGDRAWVDLNDLPDAPLEIEARWLLSMFMGLNQWLGKDWRWTVLENGQPRQSFSGSIVLPSVMDRDFMESVMTLVETKEVSP